MIEDKIIEQHEEQLKNNLAKLLAQLELEKINFENALKRELENRIKEFEKEEILKNEANLRALKNKLERELNERKRAFIEQQIEKILDKLAKDYRKELLEIINSLNYEEIIVPYYIELPGAKKDNNLKYGFIYRPVGKDYYVNMDMKRIIEKYLDRLLNQI